MLDKTLSGTVYNDKEGQAAAMAELAVKAIAKDETQTSSLKDDKYVYLPYSKVTIDNASDFFDKQDGK